MKCFIFYFLFILSLPGFVSAQDRYHLNQTGSRTALSNCINVTLFISRTKDVTTGIQQAIDSCAELGGGMVIFPKGRYLISTIHLRSNICLNLQRGAVLLASKDSSKYQNAKQDILNTGSNFTAALILGRGLSNITIKGDGSIRGQPEFEWHKKNGLDKGWPGWDSNAASSGVKMKVPVVLQPKVSLIYLVECTNISLENINVENSPNWGIHLQWCKQVRVKGINISSSLEMGVNSDGLDIDGCKDVIVHGCSIKTGDDAVCLKSTSHHGVFKDCENISVSDCLLSSSSSALKIGTETYGDFKRILFLNCIITNSNRGVGIIIRDGAHVSDVIISHLIIDCQRKDFHWWGDGDAFQFVVLKRNDQSKVGTLSNVSISDIIANVEGTSIICGFKNSRINNIRLSNIQLFMHSESKQDKRAEAAMKINEASDVLLRDVKIQWDTTLIEKKWQAALVISNTDKVKLENFRSTPDINKKDYYLVDVNNVKNILIKTDPFMEKPKNMIKLSESAIGNVWIDDKSY